MFTLDAVTYVSNACVCMHRLGAGSRYQESKLPKKPLELWSYEMSPFCKVRLLSQVHSTGITQPQHDTITRVEKEFARLL